MQRGYEQQLWSGKQAAECRADGPQRESAILTMHHQLSRHIQACTVTHVYSRQKKKNKRLSQGIP